MSICHLGGSEEIDSSCEYLSISYLLQVPRGVFRLFGFRIILSRIPTICSNFGLSARSFCQQSSISWCRPAGQSMGAGKR